MVDGDSRADGKGISERGDRDNRRKGYSEAE